MRARRVELCSAEGAGVEESPLVTRPDVIGGVGRKLSEFIAELGVGVVAQYAPGEL
jgi:hypothetical protein